MPGNVAIAPWRLLKLMPCKLSVVVCATGWFNWVGSLVVAVTTFGLRIWNVGVELMVNGESAGCGCDGLDNGEAMTFFGDGDIKWADDDPDDSGDGPHLIVWFGFGFEFEFDIHPFVLDVSTQCFLLLLLFFESDLHWDVGKIFIDTRYTFNWTGTAFIADDRCCGWCTTDKGKSRRYCEITQIRWWCARCIWITARRWGGQRIPANFIIVID